MVGFARADEPRQHAAEIRSVRILPELRAVQVERAAHMTPARTIFLGEKYDLGKTPLPSTITRLTLPRTIIELFRARETVLELPEPLWLRFLPKALVLSLAWRAGGILRRGRRQTVTYAIENNDLGAIFFGRRRPQKVIGLVVRMVLRAFVSSSFDRIAFGSAGARHSYESLGIAPRVETRAWDELPAAGPASAAGPLSGRAIFVGRLEERKGIKHLLAAWDEVERVRPDAKLTIIGGGDLEGEIDAWSRTRPESRTWVGEMEHVGIAEAMITHDVLVAPSIRWGRWREQIGLPIGEGLQAGLTIVTTDETGLAPWLKAHEHHVIPAELVSSQLARVLANALARPIPRDVVRNSLPALPGRIAADLWLHNPFDAAPTPQQTISAESTGRWT
jgi:glycosyltransferase involved in cell wall biosynthesis